MSVVDDFIESAKASKRYSFDVEHHPSLNLYKPGFKLHGCSFSTESVTMYVKNPDMVQYVTNELFNDPDIEAIAFNGGFDCKCLLTVGWAKDYPVKLVDPMIAENLLDDNLHPNQLGLKETVFRRFNHRMMMFDQAVAYGMDSKEFTKYTCEDAVWELKLWLVQQVELEENPKLLKYFRTVLMPSVKFFADMELAGIRWDLDKVRHLLRGYVAARDELEQELYNELGYINMNSGDQIAKRLFDDLGYDDTGLAHTKGREGKEGRVSTDAEAMEKLASRYPICKKILDYRSMAKAISTYLIPLSEKCLESKDGRVHGNFWLVSSTGRTRCSDPNLQNIPGRYKGMSEDLDMKSGFTATPGRKLLQADLSQIELRLMAHFSKEPLFLTAYRDWQCTSCGRRGTALKILHTCPNCGCNENEEILQNKEIKGFWHGLDLHRITADKVAALHGNRKSGKTSNFALIYGASPVKMATTFPEHDTDEWGAIIHGFFKLYKGIAAYHDYMKKLLLSKHETIDIFGRKRRILSKDIKQSERHAFNMFVNFPCQSSACGIAQYSLNKFRTRMIEEGIWMQEVFPVNFIHDEILLEVEEDLIDNVEPILQECLETSISIEVPLRTSIAIVDNWAAAK